MRNYIFVLCAIALTLGLSGVASATITNAEVELRTTPPTLTLQGLGFGASQGNGQLFLVIDANVTELSVLSWGDNLVEADLTDLVLPAGDYLSALDPDSGPLRFFGVTIGAVGPAGPAGPEGPPGPEGPQGRSGLGNLTRKVCANSFQCSCDGDDLVVSGGGKCYPDTWLYESFALDESIWRVNCTDDSGGFFFPQENVILCASADE